MIYEVIITDQANVDLRGILLLNCFHQIMQQDSLTG